MSEVSITFLGATDTVTGSRFLITGSKSRVLIDCGLFQGLKKDRLKNWEPFAADPRSIDAVLLSHAHLDHCGYLPVLIKDGFAGPIFATQYTKELAGVILNDSARLQTEDARYAAKKGYSKHNPPKALYGPDEVAQTLPRFKTVEFGKKQQVADGCFVTFYPSGHILGASFIVVQMDDKRLLFTNDLGRSNHPLLVPPQLPPDLEIDAVITESTYGDRVHEDSGDLFAEQLNTAIKRGGRILIPAFAVDRTEVILMKLRQLIDDKKIPQTPIYVDSPMALKALDYYRQAINESSDEIRKEVVDKWQGLDPFNPGLLNQMRTTEESISLNKLLTNAIIISASGMGTGGRVVHHLEQILPDRLSTVILVGFQALGTRGRSLLDGQTQIKMFGQFIPVNATICHIESFSVHADSNELITWLREIKKPKQAFVVHGDPASAQTFATRLFDQLGWQAVTPEFAKSYII
jgi:metallo-beta-lactamase family protein